MPYQVMDERDLFVVLDQLDAGWTTGWRDVGSPAHQPGRIDAIYLCNDDTIDHHVAFRVETGGPIDMDFGSVPVPAGSGGGGVPAVEYFSALGGAFAGGVVFPGGVGLKLRVEESVVSPYHVGYLIVGGSLAQS
jgi:hypothetical protein